MQITYEKGLKQLIVIFLILVLTMLDFIFVGLNFTSFAIDMINSTNDNVKIDAYFKNEKGEKIKQQEKSLNVEVMNMYVDIYVLKEGYFDGNILLQNSNLNIIGATKNDYISLAKENVIELNRVNSGKTITLELQVKPNTSSKMSVDMLNRETIVKLEGTYVYSKGQDEIKQTSIVNVKFVSPEDAKSTIDVKILTNKVYQIEKTDKRILQLIVRGKLIDNVYPVKKSNIDITLPEGAEYVEVIARDTSATNKDINFGKNNYVYNNENSRLQIMLDNLKDAEEKISFEQNAKDEFVVTCIYSGSKVFTKGTQINLAQKILTYDDKLIESDKQINIESEADGIINYEFVQEENEIYKGKLYTGEERDYKIITTSYINNTKVNKNIKFTLDDTKYINGESKNVAQVTYKEIKIKKEQYDKILGEEGYIKFKNSNGTIIQNVNKESESDKDRNIIIKIPDNNYIIEVETSIPIQTGKIDFEILKAIKEDKYCKEDIERFSAIENSLTSNGQTQTKQIDLKETQTEAKFNLNTTTLNAGENQNVQMKVVLLTNDESKDLYKNPTVKIEFPEDVTDVKAKYKTLYLNGLEKDSATLKEENNKKVIELNLSGEQQKYQGEAIDGTEILINADIKMNRLMANSKENITLTYTNEVAGSDNEKKVIQQVNVTQNEKFLVTNAIDELDIETVGNEEDKNIYLEPSEDSKEVTVKIGAINNEGVNLQNVKILGKFPTKNNTNTMDVSIKNCIEIISEKTNVKVYYSSKENATEDLEDTNNVWTEDINLEDKKSYLIVIPNLDNGESFNAKYTVDIMQNVTENKIATEDFEVIYKKDNSLEHTKIQSTKIILNIRYSLDDITATIEEPENLNLIKAGSIYLYNLKVKNNTSEEIKDIKVEIKTNDMLKIDQSYTNEIPENGIVNIEKLESGEEKNIEVFVKCLNKNKKEDEAIIYGKIYANNKNYETNKYICQIEDHSVKIKINSKASNNDKDRKVKVGEQIEYGIEIENTCVDDLKDLQIRSTMTSFLKVENVKIDGININYNENIEDENKKYKVISFKTDINAGQTKKITISTKVEGEIAISYFNDITNFVEAIYNSIVLYTKTDEGFNIKEGELINIGATDEQEEKISESVQSSQDIDTNKNDYDINVENIQKNNQSIEKKKEKYKITGSVWLDEEQKGDKSFSTKKVDGVKVKLIQEDGSVVRDESGKEIETKTNNNGEYVLENISRGKYIVIFEYDSGKYNISEYQKDGVEEKNNSDAILKDMLVSGIKSTVAATDILDLEKDVYNIDLGLVENKKFDLELTKTVNKITVTNNAGTKEYKINNNTLAKVEIESKQLNNSKVSIEYSIKVKNTGDISGYVKNIVDYIPSDIEFDSKLNKDWNKNGEYLYNSNLNNVKINPGEEREVVLILEKIMTENNTGLLSNIAEITEAQSLTGVQDVDSTYNNRKVGEDDLGQADVIIGVNTGTLFKYIIFTLCIFIILGVGSYLINQKVLKIEN